MTWTGHVFWGEWGPCSGAGCPWGRAWPWQGGLGPPGLEQANSSLGGSSSLRVRGWPLGAQAGYVNSFDPQGHLCRTDWSELHFRKAWKDLKNSYRWKQQDLSLGDTPESAFFPTPLTSKQALARLPPPLKRV